MYIISNKLLNNSLSREYYLRLNREKRILEVYKHCEDSKLRENYPIREDFDQSDYTMYELDKEIQCIYGGEGEKRTPRGIFHIYKKSEGEYRSPYYENRSVVKFFGYLGVFEDYFIHSDLYDENVTVDNFRTVEPISRADEHTAGCIRIAQEELDWLLENVEIGTVVEM